MNLQDRERKIERDTRKRIAQSWLALMVVVLIWGLLGGWILRTLLVK